MPEKSVQWLLSSEKKRASRPETRRGEQRERRAWPGEEDLLPCGAVSLHVTPARQQKLRLDLRSKRTAKIELQDLY